MIRATKTLVRLPIRFKPRTMSQLWRPFCAKPTNTSAKDSEIVEEKSLSTYDERLKQLDNLDFMSAAKMLFTGPPSKKKFGFDFHLVQFFFACMPSLAVYLVAQYSRYEMRKMEAEQEKKKREEEEAKAKEIVKELEIKAAEEKEAGSVPELLEVRERLDKLEEALKEIVVESKKQPISGQTKEQEGSQKENTATEASKHGSSESSKPVEKDPPSNPDSVEPGQAPNASLPDQEGKTKDRGASEDAKR